MSQARLRSTMPRWGSVLLDALVFGGAFLVALGFAAIWWPLGLVAAGALAMAIGVWCAR